MGHVKPQSLTGTRQVTRLEATRHALPRGIFPAALLAAFTAASAAPEASAAVREWSSPVDGLWNVSSNWAPSTVPNSLDDVTLGSVVGTTGTRTTLDIQGSVNTTQSPASSSNATATATRRSVGSSIEIT